MLEVNGLQKSYQKRLVVESLSMKVSQGQVVGLLGPNGAGKSTAFGMISGTIIPDKGSVRLEGIELSKKPLYARARLGLSYLAQESTIFKELTTKENLQIACEAMNFTKAKTNQKIERLLSQFEIEKIAHTQGQFLSGGEKRRVELARALCTEPKIMMLDEPFAGVDPIAVSEIKSMIKHLASQNIAMLITDHNVRETLAICNQATIINEGRVLVSGAPEEIVNNEEAKRYYLGEDFSL